MQLNVHSCAALSFGVSGLCLVSCYVYYGQLTSTHGVKYSHQQDMQFVDLGLRSVMRCNCSNPVALSFHFLAALFIWHFTITVIFPGICL